MEEVFTKYKRQIIMLIGLLFIGRSLYKMMHGNVTFSTPSPEGFDKDYITTVWISKGVFLAFGLLILIFGFFSRFTRN